MTAETIEQQVMRISIFRSVADYRPNPYIVAGSVEEVIELFSTHEERRDKRGAVFYGGVFSTGRRRGSRAVEAVSAVVGDFHGIEFERIQDHLLKQEIEFLAYSTFQHRRGDPRFRVIVPLESELGPEIWRKSWRDMRRELFLDLSVEHEDEISRVYYLPSCPEGAERFTFHGEGQLYLPRRAFEALASELRATAEKMGIENLEQRIRRVSRYHRFSLQPHTE